MNCSSLTALIMAGGRSERMRAGGCAHHKGLRTVLGVPLIERNLQRLLELGFEDVYVSVSARENELLKWLIERGRSLAAARRARLEILLEDAALGTIGAAGFLPVKDRDAVVVNVDNLSSIDLAEMASFHRQNQAAATIASHRHLMPIAYGVLELHGDRVAGYREKPVVQMTVSSGTYVLGRAALDRLRPGARLDAPELMNELIHGGETVVAYPHEEPWIDINDEEALFEAESLFSPSAVHRRCERPDCA